MPVALIDVVCDYSTEEKELHMGVFRKPPIDPIMVADKLISNLRKLPDGRRIRTPAVQKVLRDLADKQDYLVYPGDDGSGWLLDLIWLHRETGAIHLATESEWGNQDEVLCDFQKLLCVKSPLKIMVYWAKRSFVSEFEKYMQDFDEHLEGENYVLIEFAPEPPDHAYSYAVKNDGRLPSVEFSPLKLPN
jgi:hypothetical protein